MGTGYYDRAGNPITADQWVEAFRSNTIKSTDIGDVHVSTVYLGMDHRFGDDGPPLIFETMVFGGALDQTCERYSTEAEAVADHQRLVEQVRKEQAKDSDGGASVSAEDMTIDEALAHANCSAALSASPAHVAEALQVLAARVAELEAQQGEPVGVEWGVRFEGGDVRVYEDSLGARLAAERGFAVPAEEVVRDVLVSPWRVAT